MPGEDEHAAQRQRGHDAPEQQPRAPFDRARRSRRTAGGRRTGCRARASARSGRRWCRGPRPRSPRRPTRRSAAARLSTSQPIDQIDRLRKSGSRPRAKKWRSSQRKTSSAATSAAQGAIASKATPCRTVPSVAVRHGSAQQLGAARPRLRCRRARPRPGSPSTPGRPRRPRRAGACRAPAPCCRPFPEPESGSDSGAADPPPSAPAPELGDQARSGASCAGASTSWSPFTSAARP